MNGKLSACVNISHFLAQVACAHPAGTAGLPLVVATSTSERGTVVDACQLARARGVRNGWSVFEARRNCPALHVATIDQAANERAAAVIEAVLLQHTDLLHRVALGCWMLELRALGRNFTAADRIMQQLQADLRRATRFECVLGAAAQPIVALVAARRAAEGAPNGRRLVLPGTEAAFFEALPLRLLPGVGPRSEAALAGLGIYAIGQLAQMPERVLINLLGPRGRQLRQRARCLDGALPSTTRSSFTASWRFVERPCADERRLQVCVYRLAERVGRALRSHNTAAGEIGVRLCWVDGLIRVRTVRFASRRDLDGDLVAASRAALGELLRERRLAVSTVEVLAGDTGPIQRDLFVADDHRPRQRQHAIDRIKSAYGTGAIMSAWLLGAIGRQSWS